MVLTAAGMACLGNGRQPPNRSWGVSYGALLGADLKVVWQTARPWGLQYQSSQELDLPAMRRLVHKLPSRSSAGVHQRVVTALLSFDDSFPCMPVSVDARGTLLIGNEKISRALSFHTCMVSPSSRNDSEAAIQISVASHERPWSPLATVCEESTL